MILIVGAILGLIFGSMLLRGAFAVGFLLSKGVIMLVIAALVLALVLGA